MTQALKLASMHTMFLHTQANILAKFGQIIEIKVYMELGKQASTVYSHKTSEHKLACMHTIFLHLPTHISALKGQIRDIKVSMESGEHD